MKTWKNASIEELEIKATANGQSPSCDHDGPWVQIGGKWYAPGVGKQS